VSPREGEAAGARLPALSIAFFCSGAAALVFEVLWFRQAGLVFGNGVWASGVVLSSFMAGLVLGSFLASRVAERVASPLRFYAAAELVAGLFGLGLVLLLPQLPRLLSPLLAGMADRPALLNLARLAVSFALLVVPTTAMGTTLPVLVEAATRRRQEFGRALGSLYGWNTLGAVGGAVAAELLLIPRLGMRGSGVAAALLDVLAALVALLIVRLPATAAAPAPTSEKRSAGAPALLLAVAFLSGATFLALEVVWFRFLLLFVTGSSLAFAFMLAVVLLGIALGGLAASALSRSLRAPAALLSALLFTAGLLLVVSYAGFESAVERLGGAYSSRAWDAALLALQLALPVSLVSGAVFTLTGIALSDEGGGAARASGLLTVANTLGGAVGSLGAAFLLVPVLGMERSLQALAAAYGIAALLAALWAKRRGQPARWMLISGAAFAAALALFPGGLMERYFFGVVERRFPAMRVAARREGLTETITYLARELDRRPVSHTLVTNGHSMSASSVFAHRYMKLFVYLPVALRPAPKKALLICYGVGGTAKALTDTASLERIDVVDISRDVLELAPVAFPRAGESPLDDPRVRVHVEDGRFFLQVTPERYDLITGEPPPPGLAGVVNLYSREHFQLIRDRLTEHGLASYWLPIHSLSKRDALGIVRAFCDVFEDCSLWRGGPVDWVLLGSRGGVTPPTREGLSAQWTQPRVRGELAVLGLSSPELLGSTFLADAVELAALARDTPPVTDDFPNRLAGLPGDEAFFQELAAFPAAQRRFAESPFLSAVWPAELKAATLNSYRLQQLVEQAIKTSVGGADCRRLPELELALTGTQLVAPVLWMLGTDAREAGVARAAAAAGSHDPRVRELLGAAAAAERRYAEADRLYAAVPEPRQRQLVGLRAVLRALAGDRAGAQALLDGTGSCAADPEFRAFLQRRFGLGGGAAPAANRVDSTANGS